MGRWEKEKTDVAGWLVLRLENALFLDLRLQNAPTKLNKYRFVLWFGILITKINILLSLGYWVLGDFLKISTTSLLFSNFFNITHFCNLQHNKKNDKQFQCNYDIQRGEAP